MIWTGMIGSELVGPIQVSEGVKLNSAKYNRLPETDSHPQLDDVLYILTMSCKLIFQTENVPSHSANST